MGLSKDLLCGVASSPPPATFWFRAGAEPNFYFDPIPPHANPFTETYLDTK
jgi:hypothetical protein